MHNKFLVRDSSAVWTGSANSTTGGLRLQDNNCLSITSPALATAYTTEVETLLTAAAPHTIAAPGPVTVGGVQIDAQFSPEAGEGIEDQVVAALTEARRIRVAAFLVSDPGILQALATANTAGADLVVRRSARPGKK